jgi:hypothetical protein
VGGRVVIGGYNAEHGISHAFIVGNIAGAEEPNT